MSGKLIVVGDKMNLYCKSIINQIKVAVTSIVEIMELLEEEDLEFTPRSDKHSIRDLLAHISVICKADHLIINGASKEDMDAFYSDIELNSLDEIKQVLIESFSELEKEIITIKEDELHQKTTSYWGVTYTRHEWFLEIIAHLYHHRGQLHAMLAYCKGKNLNVQLFE